MPQCSVPGCTQQGGHKFPNDSLLRKAWIIAIKRDHPGKKGKMWIPCQTARVCHSHFKDDDFVAKNFYGNYINGKKCCFHINVMSNNCCCVDFYFFTKTTSPHQL